MALRVLLADESTTIKKVMQLALQDFAVDVKTVQSGLDVAEVARSFKPDVIFVDILLPKRNGYDVSLELKSDKAIGETPVILMWSSFMDLDENGYVRSKADSKLEKPFDVETLRSLVKEFVPKTQNQRLAHFMQFPADFVEPLEKEEKQKRASQQKVATDPHGAVQMPPPLPKAQPPTPPALQMQPEPTPAAKSTWNMENFDPLPDVMEHFGQDEAEPMKITKLGGTKTGITAPPPETGDPWAHQDLARFKLNIPEGDVDKDEISLVFDMDENAEPKGEEFLLKRTPPPPTQVESSTKTMAIPRESIHEVTDPGVSLPEPDLEIDNEHTQFQYKPIGEIRDTEGGMISQFADDVPNEHISELSLEEPPNAFEIPTLSSAPTEYPLSTPSDLPKMDADQLERVIRAQSREVIEAVVRRVVPEIAREMIQKELERLLNESSS